MMPPPPAYPPDPTQPRPIAAFVLSILGGIWVTIGGLFELIIFSYAFNPGGPSCPPGCAPGPGPALGFYVLPGIIGVILGLLILILAVLLYLEPRHHTVFGALILVFSIGSLVSSFGGFFLGFVLGLIGGILAITWRPYPVFPSPGFTTSGSPSGFRSPLPVHPGSPSGRICLKCGRMLTADTRFCPHCGNPLG